MADSFRQDDQSVTPSPAERRSARAVLMARFLSNIGVLDASSLNEADQWIDSDSMRSSLERLVQDQCLSEAQRQLIEQFIDVDWNTVQGNLSDTVSISAGEQRVHDVDETIFSEPATWNQTRDRQMFGEYKIMEEIAKGGMGVVYKAHQVKLNRIVALKMIRSDGLGENEHVKRFYTEAEAAAKLNHPNIVPVHDVGMVNGQHYYSMAFVEGESLAERVKADGPLMPKDAARYIKAIAEAVQHAHDAGVVHRDLKPANIMLRRDGQVLVTDFGLAKLQSNEELTTDGQVLGTPAYMPPEQATGDQPEVGNSADVYSLGATLYFLLTGRPPFQASSVAETLRQVLENEPVPPRSLDPSIPRDLETICLRTLRKESSKRYASADDLAADLQRWLQNRPIVARRVSLLERSWKWCKRKPAICGLSLTLLVLVVAGSIVSWERLSAARASGLVDSLLTAEPSEVERLVSEIDDASYWTHPRLEELLRDKASESMSRRAQLHVRIALAATHEEMADLLLEDLLTAELADVANIRDALGRASATDEKRLWSMFRDEETTDRDRLRAGLALIVVDEDSDRWNSADAQFLVEQLVNTDAVYQPAMWELLSPAKERLLDSLEDLFSDRNRSDSELLAAAHALAQFSSNDSRRLARLISVSTVEQEKILFPRFLEVANEGTRKQLLAIVGSQPDEDATIDDKIAMGRQRAGAAITLLKLGERESIFDVLRYDDDPEALAQFVAGCQSRGVGMEALLDCFEIVDSARGPIGDGRVKKDDSVLYAVLLALGDYSVDELPGDSSQWIDRLSQIYRHDPSSGIHSATGWLLRQWGQDTLVDRVDRIPLAYDPTGYREWFVEKLVVDGGATERSSASPSVLYFTFVVFQPGTYTLGSSPSDELGEHDELLHRVKLTKPVAVCDRELPWAVWDAYEGVSRRMTFQDRFGHELTTRDPAFGMSWHEAGEICQWLGAQRGWRDEEQVYGDLLELEVDDAGNPEWELSYGLPGYRLPTEAEWEVACRGGTRSRYSFGNDSNLAHLFAWYGDNSDEWSHPCGSLRPNPRGLFDIHGNLDEWCHDRYRSSLYDSTNPTGPDNQAGRLSRGGNYLGYHRFCRSARRTLEAPTRRIAVQGFRPAMTPMRPAVTPMRPAVTPMRPDDAEQSN